MSEVIKDLDQFVNKIIEEKKLINISPEIKKQIFQDLYKRLESRLNAIIIANVPSSKLEEFSNILSSDSDNIQDYILNNIPNIDEILAKELILFRNTYLAE